MNSQFMGREVEFVGHTVADEVAQMVPYQARLERNNLQEGHVLAHGLERAMGKAKAQTQCGQQGNPGGGEYPHVARQGGNGDGCQLQQIVEVQGRLVEIEKQKSTQRKNRGRLIRVALVGYTNVGKSTTMNLLAKSEVFAENKLFATLDTTVRKVVVENLPFLLADTVGFIRKLPTDLVDSFKSTLDEVREADLLLHIVDISHPDFEEQIQVVNKTLADLGCADKPSMIVFNKIDNYHWVEKEEDDLTPATKENITLDELKRTWMAKEHDNCLFISAKKKENIDEFKDVLYKKVRELHVQKYPYNDFLYNIEEE